ncbi:hypothetical protein NLU13_7554 [Sarocladium strictum]|uniref:Glycosyltransferase family 31 protein n=1 Tax=Sarocladium strictum TaxID=5046 RepID=A0AA39GDK3_SARSR|nr:hypothetical protein NLU13_7554 [Sarocladium strictum]
MRKPGEIAKFIMPRLTTLFRWRTGFLVLLTFLILTTLWRLHTTEPTIYKQYLQSHISKYLEAGRWAYENTLHNEDTKDAVHKSFNFSSPCENFPDTRGILLVMKTGATEAHAKLPTHLVTDLQCLPDLLLFSDLEQQIGKYHVYDALDRVNQTIRETQYEFSVYKAIQDCPVSQADCIKSFDGGWTWVLDKYKFLWMAVKTWEMRPNMDWYVFAEADSYIVWSNLAHWLHNIVPKDSLQYLGSKAEFNGFTFAHGGSGFVMSGSLLRKIVTEIPDVAHKYDGLAPGACCGDYLIALAAQEVGSTLGDVWPMFNGEKPSTLAYGPSQWCEPLLTMHHMNAEEISKVWQFEQTRKQEDHIMIKDMYHTFFAPNLVPVREDWANLSGDRCYIAPDDNSQEKATEDERRMQVPEDRKSPVERHAHENVNACSRVCEAEGLALSEEEYASLGTSGQNGDLLKSRYVEKSAENKQWHKERKCFQWTFGNGICCTAGSFRLGAPIKEEIPENRRTSGWFVQGINDWIEATGECRRGEWREPR